MFTSATYNLLILYISFLKQQQSYFSDSTFVDFYEFRKKMCIFTAKVSQFKSKKFGKNVSIGQTFLKVTIVCTLVA